MLDYRSVVDSLSHYLQGFSTIPGGFSRRISEPLKHLFFDLTGKRGNHQLKKIAIFFSPPENWKTGDSGLKKMANFGINSLNFWGVLGGSSHLISG